MGKSLSDDLRVGVVEAVEAGTSRRQAAARFGVSVPSAIRRVCAWRDRGEVRAPPRDRKSQLSVSKRGRASLGPGRLARGVGRRWVSPAEYQKGG